MNLINCPSGVNTITISKLLFAMNDYDTVMPEETTILRQDSIKSSSLVQLADIVSQNILLHPFIALRRTCQVNRKCSPFICVQPFSLIPFMYHQQRKQGIAALYRGLSSELLVKGIGLGAETAIINYTDWPREVSNKRPLRDSMRVLALRGLSVAISTPFLCAAVKETIQSVIVVRDRPSFVDCLKDGFLRLIHLRSIPSARMLPIWLVIVPTVLYHVSHTAIWHASAKCIEALISNTMFGTHSKRKTSRRTVRQHTTVTGSLIDESGWHQDELTYDAETTMEVDQFESDSNKISSSILASLVADVCLLPMETVLNSLYIQGTRTIIDNVDETTVVLPVLTNFDGFSDCYQAILKFEGNIGLYKGLGAIILQYSAHYLLFRLSYYLLKEFQSNHRAHSPLRSRKPPLRPPQSEYKRFLENNRHSTPSNPDLPKPHLDSMMFNDTMIAGDHVQTPSFDFLHNGRVDLTPGDN